MSLFSEASVSISLNWIEKYCYNSDGVSTILTEPYIVVIGAKSYTFAVCLMHARN